MKNKIFNPHLVYYMLILVLLSPTCVHAEEQKVRVVTDNASIRLRPDFDSEIIEKPSRGRVFEVERKVDEWYGIRFLSRVGVVIFGNIHEKDVEEEIIEIEEEVTEVIQEELAKVHEVSPSIPLTKEEPRKTSKIELVINGGYNLGYGISESLSYSEIWGEGVLQRVEEQGTLAQDIEKPIGFSGAVGYFLAIGLGVQLRADYNSEVEINGTSAYDLTIKFSDGDTYYINNKWGVSGNFTSMGLGGNVIFKPLTNQTFSPFLSGGVNYFTANLKLNTTIGFALSMIDDDNEQYFDFWHIPATIDTSIKGIGFNIGGGVDIFFTQNVGINLDARFFIKSKGEYLFGVETKKYDGKLGLLSLNIDKDMADLLSKEWLPAFELNPSFIKFSAGLVIKF